MKVFSNKHVESARYFASQAVSVGSVNGGQFDWEIAMGMIMVALGYAPVGSYKKLYENDN